MKLVLPDAFGMYIIPDEKDIIHEAEVLKFVLFSDLEKY